jgi:hypothetical protein
MKFGYAAVVNVCSMCLNFYSDTVASSDTDVMLRKQLVI